MFKKLLNFFRKKTPGKELTLLEKAEKVNKDIKDGKVQLTPMFNDNVDLSRFQGYIK